MGESQGKEEEKEGKFKELKKCQEERQKEREKGKQVTSAL